MTKRPSKNRFAICVNNEGCDDLQVWKLYKIVRDDAAAKDDFVRLVDESGEDYLYPASRFVIVELPQAVAKRLARIPPV